MNSWSHSIGELQSNARRRRGHLCVCTESLKRCQLMPTRRHICASQEDVPLNQLRMCLIQQSIPNVIHRGALATYYVGVRWLRSKKRGESAAYSNSELYRALIEQHHSVAFRLPSAPCHFSWVLSPPTNSMAGPEPMKGLSRHFDVVRGTKLTYKAERTAPNPCLD